ncbi:hypothetical protein GS415_00685 [Rhodococcus hoagii]|nr:hypothetical protein [Prescottella equi]
MLFTKGETVTILRRDSAAAKYGDKSYVESHQIRNVGIDDSGSDIETDEHGRRAVVDRITMICPPGADILVTDKVELEDGRVCRVEGRPQRGRGPHSGTLVELVSIEG